MAIMISDPEFHIGTPVRRLGRAHTKEVPQSDEGEFDERVEHHIQLVQAREDSAGAIMSTT